MANERLSEEEIGRIVTAFTAATKHRCRFDEIEAKRVHALSDSLDGDGMDNFRAVLEFGSMLRNIRKWGAAAIIAGIITALGAWLWIGFLAAVRKGGTP